MQEIRRSNPPVVTGIYDPNKFWAQHYHSMKLGLKLKYLRIKTIIMVIIIEEELERKSVKYDRVLSK